MFLTNWLLIANHRTRLIGVGLVLGLCGAIAQPTQAAQFVYMNSSSPTYLTGSLSFAVSNLSGIGEERVSLAELIEAAGNAGAGTQQPSFSLSVYLPQLPFAFVIPSIWEFSASHEDNPLFTFINGELAGIDVNLRPTIFFSGGDSRYSTCCFFYYGEAYSWVRGNQFSVSVRNYTAYWQRHAPFTDIRTEFYTVDNMDLLGSDESRVNFYTLEPLSPGVAIPEPTTILGLGVAAGLGGWARQKNGGVRTLARPQREKA